MKRLLLSLLILCIFLCSCADKNEIPRDTVDSTETVKSETTDEVMTETEEDSSAVTETAAVALTAEDILSDMTLEERVGQLFLARNPLSAEEGIKLIREKHVGGMIFFGRDFKDTDPNGFKKLIGDYNDASAIPLLTAVDEEGGTVCRVSLYESFRAERFASPAELYALGGLELILSDAAEKSEFLLELGINLNLAPVADISTCEDDFIFQRTLGLGRDETAEYIAEAVRVMNEKGIVSALKHFPGYGNNEDTHTGIAYDERSLSTLRENDLVPFARGIDAGVPMVMVSHNIVKNIDPDMPASLSEKMTGILRDELGFEGVIITDDLSMDAIEDFTESGEAAVLAVLAGADILCCSDIDRQYAAVLEAAEEGRISEERINESVLRILRLKLRYGIIKSNIVSN